MNEQNKNLEDIYAHYNIHPVEVILKSETVYYISDGANAYALNKKKMLNKELEMWQHHLQVAEKNKLQSVLPVFLTKSGRTHISDGTNIYYITPWIDEKSISMDEKIKYLYETIGEIHASTKHMYTQNQDDVQQTIEQVIHDVEKEKDELFNFVRQFESSHYMSPLELQVCTHYHQMKRFIDELLKRLKQLLDSKETSWNYSLCHFNLKQSHLLLSERPYLIHWEHVIYEHSSIDLLHFFHNYNTTYDAPVDLLIKHFSSYTAVNELTPSEQYLLITHLLHPKKYLSYLRHYNKHGKVKRSMIKQVQRLEVCFRQLQFGLRLSSHIDEINESPLFEEKEP